MEYIACPFCAEPDFDKPGLIVHIKLHCPDADEAWEAFQDADRMLWASSLCAKASS